MEKQTSEFRVVAYFKDVFPSPTTYKRKTYKIYDEAKKAFYEALEFYHQRQYLKHLESVAIEERLVTDWRYIEGREED